VAYRKTEDRRQKTEDRRQKTEDRRQKTEDRRSDIPKEKGSGLYHHPLFASAYAML
jgi:hypothetical protein